MRSGLEGGRETAAGGGHGDVSGVTTLSKEGRRGQPGKQGRTPQHGFWLFL